MNYIELNNKSNTEYKLSKYSRLVLEVLQDMNQKFKEIFPSHQWIADKIGCCRITVVRAMKKLRELGLVVWKGTIREKCQKPELIGKRSVNKYKLIEKQSESKNVTAINNYPSNNSNYIIINNNKYNNYYNYKYNKNNINYCLSYIASKVTNQDKKPTDIESLLDKSMACEYIKHWFGEKPVTFQVIAETPEAIERKERAEDCRDFRYRNRIFYGTLEQHWDVLCRYNKNGYGIHVAVNDLNGKARKIENVTNVNGFFLDLDGTPLNPVIGFTKKYNCEPTMIVESSPGKFHVYWKTDHCPATTWPGIMKTLAKRFGGDQSGLSVNKTLRCPGFVHQKSEPVTTTLCHRAETILPYKRARKFFPVEKPKPINREFKSTGKIWDNVQYGADKGERNESLFKFVARMRAFNVDRNDAEFHALRYADMCEPPMRQREAIDMVKRVWNRYQPGTRK